MESSKSSFQALVNNVKEEIFSNLDQLHTFVSPSAYDTAWLAMIPDPQKPDSPKFKGCLNWVLNSQSEEGFWGESNGHGLPTIDSLPSTLACMVALKRWNIGDECIEKGLAFMHANAEMLLKVDYQRLPRWFVIVFPAMVELAQAVSLDLLFPDHLKMVISAIFSNRQQILQTEEMVDKYHYHPLLSYLETLPSTYDFDEQVIIKNLSQDGSLFHSPSATARAFMLTGNQKCMDYLQSLVQTCPNGVLPMYPMDEEMIKLCIVNQIQRLGLAEHFNDAIEDILTEVYRNYSNQESLPAQISLMPAKISKDALAFRLLRMHGYNVTPRSFCWFLDHHDIMIYTDQNCEQIMSAMYNVYRATDIMFPGEYEMEEARSVSRKMLEEALILKNGHTNIVMFPSFQRLIEHELSVPWIARLDHLDHRMWIEENEAIPLWIGKASYYRLSRLRNDKLMQLAMENYEFRQSIYRDELEELKRWSKEWGLSDMGFGREKTTYCYFAVSASCPWLPDYSDIRTMVAKSAIVITVADDFYDMKVGSLKDLQVLTEAIQKWDDKGLSGPSKIIFMALDNIVSEIATKYLHEQGSDITKKLRDIWRETFASWMLESTWSIDGYIPSVDEYLETGMTSIAAHTIVLPCSCLLSPSLPNDKVKPTHFETITKLLMVMSRMLNDVQSYEKEEEEGKKNIVSLLVKENSPANIEKSVANIREILLEELKKEFIKHVFMDELGDLPKTSKHLHLSCLKVFQMFFDSTNRFDSNTELLQDIRKAIYIPLEDRAVKCLKPPPLVHSRPMESSSTISFRLHQTFKYHGTRNFIGQQFRKRISGDGCGKVFIPPKFNMCFI